MFTPLCALPLPAELFALAIHPTESLLALGLATGHVLVDRLPSPSLIDDDQGLIKTIWKTRRHKGSCRALVFSPNDGQHLISAGTDGILKCADTETGTVVSKIAVPLHNGQPDSPALLSVPTPQHLVLATDNSTLHIYDTRLPTVSPKPQQTHNPHVDYFSSLTPLPPSESSKSGLPRQFLTTGDTTIAITDLRKGIITQSEDFGEELLSSTLVDSKIVVGSEKGVLRIWEVGKWDDEPERIHVGGRDTESVDVLSAVSEELRVRLGFAEGGVVAGMGDGSISIVRLGKGKGKVVGEVRHDEIEPVGGLGFEVGGRMVSGGGTTVKVWEEAAMSGAQDDGFGNVLNEESSDDGSAKDDGDADEVEVEEDSSDEEEKKQKKRKKRRKRGKGKPNTGNGILSFKGMD